MCVCVIGIFLSHLKNEKNKELLIFVAVGMCTAHHSRLWKKTKNQKLDNKKGKQNRKNVRNSKMALLITNDFL